ncbi:MAG: helix-turn-helix domain-containing protein [Candidatus Pacebacteria bacterium]|nr:helix-turn-helix domain-containing protein [Candidatus Paceibacterota bacterium]
MKTVGKILKETRKKKEISLVRAASSTRIRLGFLRSIENNDFARLPSAASAYGFVKNYAEYLGVSTERVLAVFRRDFLTDKKGRVVPRGLVKPLDTPGFFRSSRLGFFLATFCFIAAILAYLGWQYFSLSRGPQLALVSPDDQVRVFGDSIEVAGNSEPDATVRINGESIVLSGRGDFTAIVFLKEGKNVILVEATNKWGKKTRQVREVYR